MQGFFSNLSVLLKQLSKYFPREKLPQDARTLLHTRRKTSHVTFSDGGLLNYFGIANGVMKIIDEVACDMQKISLYVNVDGIPLFKSSSTSFWPILVSIKECNSRPCAVAMYCGSKKPPLNEFLSEFMEEL